MKLLKIQTYFKKKTIKTLHIFKGLLVQPITSRICSLRRFYNPLAFSECDLLNQTIYRICYHISNTTGATCGAGSAYPSGAPEITPSFWWGSCCLYFSLLCCVMCTIVCLFVLSMAFSVYFRFMSLTVPLVSFVPLLQINCPNKTKFCL